MATYIYCSNGDNEVDTTEQGAEWLTGVLQSQQGEEAAKAFAAKFKDTHTAQKTAMERSKKPYDYGPVFDLFTEHSQDIFSAIPPESRADDRVREVESFFALVFSMLLNFYEEEHLHRATTRLCEQFKANSQQQPELRLRLLMMLYNTFTQGVEFRYRVFKYILDYSAEAGLFDQVLPYMEYLDSWMDDWKRFLTLEDKRTLFRDISTYMRQLGKRVDCFLYLKRYHLLHQGEPEKVLKDPAVADSALELLKDAVQIPSVIQYDDILALDTVKALAKTNRGDLVRLCEVLFQGSVNDLRDFHKKHEKLFAEHGIKFQDCMSKIRLLTLATLAQSRSEMSLAEVAKELELGAHADEKGQGAEEDSVERWVVRAISEGVIDGRIDQLNQKVLIKSAFQRKFEKEEWAFLDSKLTQWIDNLENVIKFIGQQKSLREAGPQAAAA